MQLVPEEIIEFVDMDKSQMPVYIKVNTLNNELTFEVPETILIEWFLNYVSFGCGFEVYLILYFDEHAALLLSKYCIQHYPDTIKSIV